MDRRIDGESSGEDKVSNTNYSWCESTMYSEYRNRLNQKVERF